jgi:hypothetical protein
MGDSEVAVLRQEVMRLTVELDRTSAEKEQAAQYGLVLLEEKDSLELRCQVVNRMVGGGTRQDQRREGAGGPVRPCPPRGEGQP